MGNQNSGRRPQPTALKMLRGNPSKTPLNGLEPRPPKGEPAKPRTITAGASAIWDEIAPDCVAMGTLTKVDGLAFKTLCELQFTFDIAASQKSAEAFAPFTIGEDYNAVPTVKVHAALRLERETAAALRPYYEKFGLEPVGRARIQVPKDPDEPVSKWAGVLT